MSWKKYLTEVPLSDGMGGMNKPLVGGAGGKGGQAKTSYSSYLPDVYSGAPN